MRLFSNFFTIKAKAVQLSADCQNKKDPVEWFFVGLVSDWLTFVWVAAVSVVLSGDLSIVQQFNYGPRIGHIKLASISKGVFGS